MARYYLLTRARSASGPLYPGTVLDDAQRPDVAAILASGARTYPAPDATVAAAAARCAELRLRGGSAEQAEALMLEAASRAEVAAIPAPGSGALVSETLILGYGYSNANQTTALTPTYPGGAAVDDSVGPFVAAGQLFVPLVAVGDDQAAALNNFAYGGAGGPAVTVTVEGLDARGTPTSCTFTTDGAGKYQPDAARAMKVITRVATSADLTRALGVYTGKGLGTAQPFADGSLEAYGFDGGLDLGAYQDGASGTFVPLGDWSAAGGTVLSLRYRAR